MRGRKTFAFFLISKYLNVKEVHEDLGIILIQKDAVASARTIPQTGRQTDTGSETKAGCPNGAELTSTQQTVAAINSFSQLQRD